MNNFKWGDPFQLLETVRGELDTMERLAELAITGDRAQAVLKAPKGIFRAFFYYFYDV